MNITRVERFEAAAPGPEGRVRVFAFDLEATIAGPVDPRHGMVVNLTDMKGTLRREVVTPWQGRLLDGTDGLPDYRTPEQLVLGLWQRLGGELAGRPLVRLRLIAQPGPVFETFGESVVHVTRIYEFSASHRLHSRHLTDDENLEVFDKCNNPEGHGHNYVLEVTVAGKPAENGELLSERTFDAIVNESVVRAWDHKHLNRDVAAFSEVNPTAEEIARVAWRSLAPRFSSTRARLFRIKLRETARNHVEYFGEDE